MVGWKHIMQLTKILVVYMTNLFVVSLELWVNSNSVRDPFEQDTWFFSSPRVFQYFLPEYRSQEKIVCYIVLIANVGSLILIIWSVPNTYNLDKCVPILNFKDCWPFLKKNIYTSVENSYIYEKNILLA